MDWRDRITIDPNVCQGKACIKGTRVMVSVVFDNLADGESYEEIMSGYRLTREDIQARAGQLCPMQLTWPRSVTFRSNRRSPDAVQSG